MGPGTVSEREELDDEAELALDLELLGLELLLLVEAELVLVGLELAAELVLVVKLEFVELLEL
jgi:hypothetical protein